jgi:hypothetical protein
VSNKSLHPDVERELASRFSGQDLADAKLLLETTPLVRVTDLSGPDGMRIHLGAIFLAGGSLEKLRSAMRAATEDWRDVLVAAGLGHSDWRQVLANRGFRAPR